MERQRSRRNPRQEAWVEQAHVDIGALAQRVTGLEGAIASVVDQIHDLAKKLDTRPTNWYGVIAGVGVILTLGGGFFYQAIAPVNSEILRNSTHIDKLTDVISKMAGEVEWKTDVRDYERQARIEAQRLADRQRADEGAADASFRTIIENVARLDERTKIAHEDEMRAADRMQTRVDSIDLQLVKRPEIEAANHALGDRIDEIEKREGDTRTQLESLFPPAEMIKEIWASIRDMRGGALGAVSPDKK
ncbi:MAG: hypothetical protein KGL39_54140 [Patescibacteria group bacterium]|nr:hypothetical protein [Patescibacteria group bacterium]